MTECLTMALDIDSAHKSVDDIVQILIDYLGSIDLATLNAQDLNTYAVTVRVVYEMHQPGYAELLSTMLAAGKKEEVRDG